MKTFGSLSGDQALDYRSGTTAGVGDDRLVDESDPTSPDRAAVVTVVHPGNFLGDAARRRRAARADQAPKRWQDQWDQWWSRTAGDTPPRSLPWYRRLPEIAIAATVLVVSSPLMLAVAIIIKRGTPGPILFRQTRVGLHGRPFKFLKFRTLYADARQRFPELYRYSYDEQQLKSLKFKVDNDPRVTPQGRWLRRTTLDELPNFWNVLTGDMSLVGPRPEIPEMLPYYHGQMLEKFTVRPGVTGLAQTSGRGRLQFYETVRLDVENARRKSFFYDLRILLKTVKMVVLRDGAF